MPILSRRHFLGSSLAAMCAGPLAARAASGAPPQRFLFVHAVGGWDPLSAFAPKFGAPDIDMARGDEPLTIGNFQLVDGPGRPNVRSFFEQHGDRSLLLHGMNVRSVNHDTCAAVAMTGFTADDQPDWGTLVANEARDVYTIPHVVFSGPTFTGPHGVIVSRAAGLMDEVMKGDLLGRHQAPLSTVDPTSRFLAARAASFQQDHPGARHAVDWVEASARSSELIARSQEIDLGYRPGLIGAGRSAVKALADGLCGVASIGSDFIWDTHTTNLQQRYLFNDLFGDLQTLVALLDSTPGPSGAPLADDTVLVVMSEMGRTPAFNLSDGRDHWPFTSMLLLGNGLKSGREAGGYSDGYIGVGIDPATGETDPSRPGVSGLDVGATLLQLAGVDPSGPLPSATPLPGLLQ